MDNNCIFCNGIDNIVFESNNFYIKIGKGIICEGHCMLIPKKHIDCIANIDLNIVDEFLNLKNKLTQFLTQNFYKPFIVEHGAVLQSVFHAHMHFIPLKSQYYDEISIMKQMFFSFIEKNDIIYKKINSFGDLIKIYEEDKEYLYFEECNDIYVVETKKNKKLIDEIKEKLSYRSFFANKINLAGIKNWKTMTEEDIVLDNLKIEKTTDKFKDFYKFYLK